ncbi:serine/arginine-rich splicing factor 6-like isoform X2 [Clinocottus analis]|uniref:serine/arginine-rich splicing factor 6-like isoform X2 n=1 Tax=Clinocottus analis TaxID=304258 RepID=UPI0035C1E84D
MPRVYIGRLSYNVREKDIQRFFSGYGKLMEVDLKNGYGFVEFEDNRDADDAVYELNGKELCGERVIVENARGPRRDRDGYGSGYSSRSHTGRDKYGPPVRTEYRLIVENLSSRCSWQDLKDFMRQAGEVTYADAHKERTNEGVIEFRSESDLKRAIDKLDGTDINGRKIRLVADRSRKRKSYSGSRSRSRSRRRSRSRSRKSSRSRSRSLSRSRSPSNKRRPHSRSRSGRKSRSKSGGRKSRSRTRRSRSRSRSRSRKSRSRSADQKSKSRSPSNSKVKSERSRSKEICGDKSRSHSASPMANGKEEFVTESPARSPSPQKDDRRSKSREKCSASRSRSRSRSKSASQD